MKKHTLTGTYKQQGHQLYEMMKNETLTHDELQQIVPVNIPFMEAFCDVIEQESKKDAAEHQQAMSVILAMVDTLRQLTLFGNIGPSERMRAIDTMKQMADILVKMDIERSRNSTRKQIAFGGFLTVALVATLGYALHKQRE